MSVCRAVKVVCWDAWAPGLGDKLSWRDWAHGAKLVGSEGRPDLSFIPAMQRRRLSPLNRMAVSAAHGCLGESQSRVRSIFCSQHGDVNQTTEILRDIARGEDVSPTAFSTSVHNAGAGLFSVFCENTEASVSLAAGKSTFEAGMTEAWTLLEVGECDQVLLVVYDEPLPCEYGEFACDVVFPYAAAFLLEKLEPNGAGVSFTKVKKSNSPGRGGELPHALEFLRFMLSGAEALTVQDEPWASHSWQWGKLGG